jgi:hypothetical protein
MEMGEKNSSTLELWKKTTEILSSQATKQVAAR